MDFGAISLSVYAFITITRKREEKSGHESRKTSCRYDKYLENKLSDDNLYNFGFMKKSQVVGMDI